MTFSGRGQYGGKIKGKSLYKINMMNKKGMTTYFSNTIHEDLLYLL
jgi:hypothetical protein